MEATSSSLALLRSFGEAVVDIKMSHDNLFELLNLYDAICKLQPEVSYGYKALLNKFRSFLYTWVYRAILMINFCTNSCNEIFDMSDGGNVCEY